VEEIEEEEEEAVVVAAVVGATVVLAAMSCYVSGAHQIGNWNQTISPGDATIQLANDGGRQVRMNMDVIVKIRNGVKVENVPSR